MLEPVQPAPLRNFAPLLLTLLLAGGAPRAAAQEGEEEPGPDRIELTIEEALALALGNDLGLQIEAISTEVSSFNAAGSWGSFDPIATATAALIDAEFLAANPQFTGVPVIDSEVRDLQTNLLFPLTTGGSFDLGLSLNRSESNNNFNQQNPKQSDDSISLAFNQPLLRGFGRKFATSVQREQDLLYRQQLERYRGTRQDLLLSVENAYWDLVAAIQQLGVAEETLSLGREQLDQNQRRLDAGVGTEVEVLQAEANVATQVEQRLLREVAVKDAADNLRKMLRPGIDPQFWESDLVPVTELPSSTTVSVPGWQAALVVALEKRPDLRQQRIEIDASEERLIRSVNDRRARLDLSLSTSSRGLNSDSGEALEQAAEFDFLTNRFAFDFSVPLGNRTARYAEKAARAQLRQARLTYDQLENDAVAEVRSAVRQVLYQAEAVAAADVSQRLARRQLEAEQARFREGLSTNFEVLDFQRQLAEALFTHTQARASFAKAKVALDEALGVLGETGR